ncbi:unnamed protein product [Parnassius apollo]|uniref:(apollo) hypothetical protein n=1 Tax=Parnassius apollo TaxID=110799 RepID=A0A8S3WCY9_PARAO|nr:unnamed protein product [Parnassius apollo]
MLHRILKKRRDSLIHNVEEWILNICTVFNVAKKRKEKTKMWLDSIGLENINPTEKQNHILPTIFPSGQLANKINILKSVNSQEQSRNQVPPLKTLTRQDEGGRYSYSPETKACVDRQVF